MTPNHCFLLAFFFLLSLSLGFSCKVGEVDLSLYKEGGSTNEDDCESCPKDCQVCTVRNKEIVCSICDKGHFLTDEYTCKKCEENCEFCVGSGLSKCVKPDSGYGYNPIDKVIEECENDCDFCPDSTSSKCFKECQRGFYIKSSEDTGEVTCADCPLNCDSCSEGTDSSGKTKCLVCADGFAYNLDTGSCTEDCSNCETCSASAGFCYSCKPDHYYYQGKCIETGEYPEDDSCQETCKVCSRGTCLECQVGHVLKYGKCEACPENCAQCSSSSKCLLCGTGFSMGFNEDLIKASSFATGNGVQGIEWGENGYNTSSCTTCSVYGSECVMCDHRLGICLGCAQGKVFNPLHNKCEDCGIEKCVSCKTTGVCAQCLPGTFWDGSFKQCRNCMNGCSECIGPNDADCISCPITKWAYWHPYHVSGSSGSIVAPSRAPGPYSSGFEGYGLECVSKCDEVSAQGHAIHKKSDLRTCWVETDEQEIVSQTFSSIHMVSNKSPSDHLEVINKIAKIFWETVGSKESPKIKEDGEYIYLMKKSAEGEHFAEENCNFNGVNQTSIDPIGRKAQFCECDKDENGEEIFYGMNCELNKEAKNQAESIIRDLFIYSTMYKDEQYHQETYHRINTMAGAASTGILHLRYTAEAIDEILDLVQYIDSDVYTTFYEDFWALIPTLASSFARNVVSQLAYPDPDFSLRFLVGDTTEEDMRNGISRLALLFSECFAGMDRVHFDSMTLSSIGWQQQIEKIEDKSSTSWQLCTRNMIGRKIDGFNVDSESYESSYKCIAENTDGKYESSLTQVSVGLSSGEMEDNFKFIANVEQFVAVFLTEDERAVTNMVFYGQKTASGSEANLGEVELTLVVAFNFPGSIDSISCGYFSPENSTVSSSKCETEVDSEFSNRIICTCSRASGWVVGYISSEEASSLVEEAHGTKYQVAFSNFVSFSITLLFALMTVASF